MGSRNVQQFRRTVGKPVSEHLFQILRQRAQRFPNAVALGAQEGLGWRTLDSRQLLGRVDALARELAARGVRGGDRVVLWTPSGLGTPTYLFALWKLGAVVVPFDKDMNAQAALAILESVQPRLVILGYDQKPAWAPPEAVEWWEPPVGSAISERWQPPDEQ